MIIIEILRQGFPEVPGAQNHKMVQTLPANGTDQALSVKDLPRAQWQKAYGNPNYAASFQGVGLTSDGGFVAGGYTLEYNGQNEVYVVKTDSGGNVNKCADVQGTSAIVTRSATA